MELGKQCLLGLKAANELDSKSFSVLALLAFSTAERGQKIPPSKDVIEKLSSEKPTTLKLVFASILTCIFEAAKTKMSTSELSDALKEVGLKTDRIKLLSEAYKAKKNIIRKNLSGVGLQLPKVIDLNWRLDYRLRSSATGKVRSQLYILSFKILGVKGNYSEKQITCTVEQLQDLLGKVEDAKKQVDRVMKAVR